MDDKIIEYRNSIIMDSQYIGTLKDLIVLNDERFLITKLMPYTDPIEGYVNIVNFVVEVNGELE
jgi:hypothetical protein